MTILESIAYYSIIPIMFIIGQKELKKNKYKKIFIISLLFTIILKIFLWNYNIYITQFIYFSLVLFTIQIIFEEKDD